MKNKEIRRIDLSDYHLSETTKKMANNHFMIETKNCYGEYMLEGRWDDNYVYDFACVCDFKLKQHNSYSAWAYSDDQMALFTYCEGDICLTPYKNERLYRERKLDMMAFYAELDS